MSEREEFLAFLKKSHIAQPTTLFKKFDAYHKLLVEKNSQLNLVSRATKPETIWTKHFLDSLLPLKCLDFSGKRVLDFGSGGGLPGIPVKLAVPDCEMLLLDSIAKKAAVLREFVDLLQLEGCQVLCSRLEDGHPLMKPGGFDYILIRAVKMEDRYRKPLRELLVPGGSVIFYKAMNFGDIHDYHPRQLLVQPLDYGLRAIMGIPRENLI